MAPEKDRAVTSMFPSTVKAYRAAAPLLFTVALPEARKVPPALMAIALAATESTVSVEVPVRSSVPPVRTRTLSRTVSVNPLIASVPAMTSRSSPTGPSTTVLRLSRAVPAALLTCSTLNVDETLPPTSWSSPPLAPLRTTVEVPAVNAPLFVKSSAMRSVTGAPAPASKVFDEIVRSAATWIVAPAGKVVADGASVSRLLKSFPAVLVFGRAPPYQRKRLVPVPGVKTLFARLSIVRVPEPPAEPTSRTVFAPALKFAPSPAPRSTSLSVPRTTTGETPPAMLVESAVPASSPSRFPIVRLLNVSAVAIWEADEPASLRSDITTVEPVSVNPAVPRSLFQTPPTVTVFPVPSSTELAVFVIRRSLRTVTVAGVRVPVTLSIVRLYQASPPAPPIGFKLCQTTVPDWALHVAPASLVHVDPAAIVSVPVPPCSVCPGPPVPRIVIAPVTVTLPERVVVPPAEAAGGLWPNTTVMNPASGPTVCVFPPRFVKQTERAATVSNVPPVRDQSPPMFSSPTVAFVLS